MTWLEQRIENLIKRIINDPNTKRIPIGPNIHDPTYWRWFVWPRNRWVNAYLHNFRHDDDEHLHDHRAFNISFLLQGRYFEERFIRKPREGYPLPEIRKRLMPRIIMRLPATPHRIVLDRDVEGREVRIWSLFIKFPDVRDWGFWCPGLPRTPERSSQCRWVPWQQYVQGLDPTAVGYGQRGAGCDE